METSLRKEFEKRAEREGDSLEDAIFSEELSLIDMSFNGERCETDLDDLHLIGVMCWTPTRVYVTFEDEGMLRVSSALRNPPETV